MNSQSLHLNATVATFFLPTGRKTVTQGQNIRVERKGDMDRGDSGAYSPLYQRKPMLTGFNTFSANVWHYHQHYDKRCILRCTTKFSVIHNSLFCECLLPGN